MDSRAVQSHANAHNEHHHPHNLGMQEVAHRHGDDQHHHDHEKKSVLKKVKQKARKIKDTITKHGHHDHEHGHEYHYDDQHIPDDRDLDEEDDEDDDMVEGPELHGAPIYDSATVRRATAGPVNTGLGEQLHNEPRVVVVSPTSRTNQSRSTDPTRTFVGGERAVHPKVNLERPMGLEEDPHAPGSRLQAHAPANYQTKVTDPTGAGGVEIDITPVEKSFNKMTMNQPIPNPEPKVLPTVAETHYPSLGSHPQYVPELSTATKTHYPSAETYGQYLPQPSSEVKTQYPKSHDQFASEFPTSTNTTHYPFAKSHDQHSAKTQYPSTISHDRHLPLPQQSSATKTQHPSTISHDQYLPPQHSSATNTLYPSAGTHDQFLPESSPLPYITQTYNTTPSTTLEQPHQPANQSSYTDKISSAASAITDKAVSAKNTVASKLGYEEQPQQPPNQSSYTGKISSATSAIADKAASAKNTVASKLGYDEQPQQQPQNQTSYTDKICSATSAIADKAVSAKNTVASKLGYGEKDDTTMNRTNHREVNTSTENPSNQTSYTEKISSATSAIADKAVSAKNTVASKLGFGERVDTQNNATATNEQNRTKNNAASYSSSPTEYGKRVASSLTDMVAPGHGEVAGVGSAVKSKVPGTGTEEERVSDVYVEQDKGVSMKDYLVDKLRPSEEDRALSEVISETLHKKGPMDEVSGKEEEDMGVRKMVSDDMLRRQQESERRVNRPLGKVTESEEVKRRLGTGDEETERRYEEMYANTPGTGVVDKLKGMVGSLFTKPEENQSSQGGESMNYGAKVNQGAGERRLHESSN